MRQIDSINKRVTGLENLPHTQTTQATNPTWEYKVVGGLVVMIAIAILKLLF